ncbi:tRNA (carboxymethyluridine(34)-5-O)-methyltransferase alkbh8-like [Tubulanus polymorphus]|uniref:tRNA (carboxymethyluridine(34)-5-O)-methyltransferase alkbh8-like n=1 Tax=Tubulanus polymorphus TaxID=672921 RepID=UPI003DA424C0
MFSKMERKMMKKQVKANKILMKHDGIMTVDHSTRNLYIGNGGLGNQVKREELHRMFHKFGAIQAIVMLPGKPYSFVSFCDVETAEKAHIHTNGRLLKCPEEISICGVKFYTAFVENVPQPCRMNQRSPPGLILKPNFVDEAYEERLLDCIKWDETLIDEASGAKVERSMKHRRVKHFGYEFIYGKNNIDKDHPLPDGIPSECDELIDRLLALGCIKNRPNQLTINQYTPGQGIPPHIDTHSAFEDGIVSLSLGAQVVMDFRHPNGYHVPVVLPRRSVLIMSGESRYLWSHGITPRKSDIIPSKESDAAGEIEKDLTLIRREMRTSFTFRVIRQEPCTCKFPKFCDSQANLCRKNVPSSDEEAVELEKTHVHQVYNDIASHFSDTRHSPWPKVTEFLQGLPDGALVTDVGCGNGKYLSVNKRICMVGNDHSINLAQICRERNFHVFVCDCLSVPLRPVFDACICIAVIHHLSTQERRLAAIQEIVNILCKGGKALIYVWALEQELNNEKSNYLKVAKDATNDKAEGRADGLNCDDNQNIAFTQQTDTDNSDTSQKTVVDTSHLASTSTQTDSPTDCNASTSTQTESSDSLPIHVNRTPFEKQDVLVPWHMKAKQKNRLSLGSAASNETSEDRDCNPVFHRFYHVFRQGELETLCETIPGVEVIHSYYDKGNWCVIIQKNLVI